MLERDSILKGLTFGFSPPHIGYSLAQESDHQRILTLDLERISGEELRDPVRHDLLELLSRYRLEAAQKLGAHGTGVDYRRNLLYFVQRR